MRCWPHANVWHRAIHGSSVSVTGFQIAHSNHLRWMDPWGPPEDDMDIIRGVSGANFVEPIGGYDGTGVSGEVLDSGIKIPGKKTV